MKGGERKLSGLGIGNKWNNNIDNNQLVANLLHCLEHSAGWERKSDVMIKRSAPLAIIWSVVVAAVSF